MNTASSPDNTSNTLMSTLGESYEYARTLLINNIEIKKLEALNSIRLAARKMLLGIIITFFSFLISSILLVLGIYQLYIILESLPLALLISAGVLFLLLIGIYLFRSVLIYKSVDSRIVKFMD